MALFFLLLDYLTHKKYSLPCRIQNHTDTNDKVTSWQDGYDTGYEDGREDGYYEGHEDGYDEGFEDGQNYERQERKEMNFED